MILKPKPVLQQIMERICQHGKPQKITELCLDEISIPRFSPQLTSVVEKCKNIEHLSVASCGLSSLNGLPQLIKLRYLNLQQNAFTDINLAELQNQFQTLQGLNISRNNVRKLESIMQCVNKLSIRQINIFETTIFQSNPKLIESLFENCKSLQCINWQDRRGKEVKQFEAESSESDNQNESQNNQKNFSEQNDSLQDDLSMQTSKKVKVQ